MKTPRTDAVVQSLIWQHARELEIENSELQSTINTLHNLCVSAEKRAFQKLEAERAAAMPNDQAQRRAPEARAERKGDDQ